MRLLIKFCALRPSLNYKTITRRAEARSFYHDVGLGHNFLMLLKLDTTMMLCDRVEGVCSCFFVMVQHIVLGC